MKRIISVGLVLLAGSLMPANAELINFEWYPGPDGILGTPDDVEIIAPGTFGSQTEQLTDQFASVGILFTPDPPTQDKNEILDAYSFSTPPEHTPPNILASSGSLTIDGTFTIPIFEIGALIGISGGSELLEIFDAGNNLLGSVIGDDEEVVLTTTVPIDRFVISAATGSTAAIDNLYFVPEPASVVLLGLAGLLIRRR